MFTIFQLDHMHDCVNTVTRLSILGNSPGFWSALRYSVLYLRLSTAMVQILNIQIISFKTIRKKISHGASSPYIIDHEMHNALGHEVTNAFVDDGHVGVHQVADGLHLPL